MTRPSNQVVQMTFQNPGATMPLIVPVMLLCNTPDEEIERNIRTNTARADLQWVGGLEAHDRIAVVVGGGPSVADDLDKIRALGGDIYATNAASKFLRGHGIPVDYQVIADAKEETATLVDSGARGHLFASQCNPATINAVAHPRLWHLEIGNVERLFPEERVAKGGYALVGSETTVGNAALCLVFAKGYRKIHIFGFDSCHKDGRSHAYDQPLNLFMPGIDVEWGGRKFYASLAMKAQAETFQMISLALKQNGCELHVYGDGLLQTMYRTPADSLTEREKYRTLWQFDGYRQTSPGEATVPTFLEVAKPDGTIIDFGCGTGRAALAMKAAGHDVVLLDFADNCRDEEAMGLPFLEWDLTQPCVLRAPFGFCSDVMEHIPPADVDTVIRNIMGAADAVFFQISTTDDIFGIIVHATLHNTIRPHDWWVERFTALGFVIEWQEDGDSDSRFYVRNLSDRTN